ncbi:MAG TPA: hypothetical protein VHA70_02485 [Bauldia sp.]|nr:hypothetical protein [Bauldia sp.]
MRTALAAAIVSLAAPAFAEDAAPPASTTPAPATLACTNAGLHYAVGEFACIAACHGERRLARCDAVAEKATWTYVQENCPSAMINPPWPSEWSEVPALAAMSPRPVNVNRSVAAPDVRFAFVAFNSKQR